MLRSPPQPMWDLTIHPSSGPNILACTRSPLQSMSFPSLVDVGVTSLLAHYPVSGFNTICNSSSPSLANIVLFRLSLKIFKMCLLERGFCTLIKNVLFYSPTDVGYYNPYPSGASVLAGTRSPLQSMLFPSPIDIGSRNPHPFGAQRPC